MIIAELHVVRVTVFETEAYAPLIVDGDRVLSRPITLEHVELITGWYSQIGEPGGDMHGFKLPQGASCHVRRDTPCLPGPEQLLGLPIGKGLDHVGM